MLQGTIGPKAEKIRHPSLALFSLLYQSSFGMGDIQNI